MNRDGFTLLEVLAAALIFAMVVTVLIGTSSKAVFMSGLSASRLEASAIAERELARLEAILNAQGVPPDDIEEVRDRFSIRVFSEPAIGDFGVGGAGDGTGPLPSLPPSSDSSGEPAGGVAAILAVEAPGLDEHLRRYEIRVEWIEGAVPESIVRTTYGFDWQTARELLPDLFQTSLEDGGAPMGGPGQEALEGLDPGQIPQIPLQGTP